MWDKGKKQSPEHIAKRVQKRKEKGNYTPSKEQIEQQAKALKDSYASGKVKSTKGKTLEEKYGFEKAKEIKDKIKAKRALQVFPDNISEIRSKAGKKRWEKDKGKTLEERFGEEKAKEIKKKLSDSHIGQVPGNKGKKQSKEACENMSKARRKLLQQKPEIGKKFAEIGKTARTGMKNTTEQNKKISKALKGKKRSTTQEQIDKRNESLKKSDYYKKLEEKRKVKKEERAIWELGRVDREKERQRKLKEARKNNPNSNRGGLSKYYETVIGFVQGKHEKAFIDKLILEGKQLPTRPKGLDTPDGLYFPDFEFEDKYIEIKSKFTYDVFCGKQKSLSGIFDLTQRNKATFISKTLKPVEVLITDKHANILFSEIL